MLVKELKARGRLDDAIVIWTTEFGRMPCGQGSKGRDHNPFTFTNWVAGGGFKGETSCGESDVLFRPARDDSSLAEPDSTVRSDNLDLRQGLVRLRPLKFELFHRVHDRAGDDMVAIPFPIRRDDMPR